MSWGALFAGLVVIAAVGWLLTLLGSAFGVSVADSDDVQAMSSGFGIAAMLWFLMSWLVAYFVGALLTTRLAGSLEQREGVLHGVTLWGLGSVATVLLGWWGLSGVAKAGQQVVVAGANVAQSAAGGVAQGASSAWDAGAQMVSQAAEVDLPRRVRAELKREASRVLASADTQGGAEVSAAEVRGALEEIDAATLEKLGGELVAGDRRAAEETLAEATDLSQAQVRSLVEGAARELEEAWQGSQAAEAVEASFRAGAQELAQAGGSELSQAEARRALEQLDADVLQQASMALLQGDTEGAEDAVAEGTTLTESQVEAVVGGVARRFEAQLGEFRQQVDDAVQATADYTQAVLWAAFVGAALALLAAIGGAAVGTTVVARIETLRVRERAVVA